MQHETGVDLPHSAAHNENGQSAAVFLPHDIRARQEQLERLREQASGGQSTTMAEGD